MIENADQGHNYAHHNGVSRRITYSTVIRLIPFVIVFFLGYGFGLFISPRISLKIAEVKDQRQGQLQQQLLQQKQQRPNDLVDFHSACAAAIPNTEITPTILAKVYNNTSPYLNFPPPHLRPLLATGLVQGWGSTNTVFETLIRSTRPKTIIEIGTFLGASTLHMAKITKMLGLADTVILCLDDFRAWPGYGYPSNGKHRRLVDVNGDVILMQQFMQNVVDAGEATRILPVPFSTTAGLEALCMWGVFGDLVEVDAAHDFHSAWTDINRAWKVLRPGGVMFGHDYYNGVDSYGVKRAVNLFAKLNHLQVRPDGEHWILSPRPAS